MNKYQKIAAQCAKDALEKEIYQMSGDSTFRELRNASMRYFRKSKVSLKGARAYKRYFKDKWF